MSWIGVDLDGTLAFYDGWRGYHHIGPPVPAMLQRVKDWIEQGQEVRIMTARACNPAHIPFVIDWCKEHIGVELPVTNEKDYQMHQLWDDRAVVVEKNTGRAMSFDIPEPPLTEDEANRA